MSELNLTACPICHESNSLFRQAKVMQGNTYVWYECRQCGSVLLWMGGDKWAYQKVGAADKTHLLKQPLTAVELQDLLPAVMPAHDVVPIKPLVSDTPARQKPAQEQDAARRAEDQYPQTSEKRKTGMGRLVIGAIVVASICLIVVAVGIVLTMLSGNWPLATVTEGVQATEGTQATATPYLPTDTPTPKPTATWVPTLTPLPPPSTATPPLQLLRELDAIDADVIEMRSPEVTASVSRTLVTRRELVSYLEDRFEEEHPPDIVERDAQVMESFGFVPSNYDLLAVYRALYTNQVLGLYDAKTDILYVITDISGGEFDLFAQITHVHEYGLALQDERFDLNALLNKTGLNDDEFLARQALVEGDATEVMAESLLILDPTDEELLDVTTRDLRGNKDLYIQLPTIVRLTYPTPSSLSSLFITALREHGGWEAVDAAFSDPPQSTEQVLHLDKYLAREEPVRVALPPLTDTLGAGWYLVKTNTLGEFQLHILLDEQLDGETALTAGAGWGGDQYALYTNDDATVLVYATTWDRPKDRKEFVQAYEQYAEARYGQPVTLTNDTETWWETPTQAVVLTWADTTTLLILGPDRAIVEKVLEASRQSD